LSEKGREEKKWFKWSQRAKEKAVRDLLRKGDERASLNHARGGNKNRVQVPGGES